MTPISFLNNDQARISFAVIGIFLILGSSATSVYVSYYDQQRNSTNLLTSDQQHIETLLSSVRIDLSQLINQAGVDALQYISSHPVIKPGSDFDSAVACNQFRLKNKISSALMDYLYCNYESKEFTHNDYVITADFSKIPENHIPFDHMTITPIEMNLKRPVSIPFFGPELEQNLPVYYQIRVDIPFKIHHQTSDHRLQTITRSLSISTLLTSRYLGLQELVSSFNQSLQNFGPFWKTITLLTNIYSMARGYRHYQTGSPQNVVDNHHLELITNLAFLFEEALFFGGIDPSLLIESLKRTKSLFSETSITNLSSVNSFTSPQWDVPFNDLKQPFAQDSSSDASTPSPQIINISDVASSILWEQTSILLEFTNDDGQKQQVTYQLDSDQSLKDIIQEYNDNGWILADSSSESLVQNVTTIQKITSIAESVYAASFSTMVTRDGPRIITQGSHEGFPIDNGSSPWQVSSVHLVSQQSIPEKGTIQLGSTMFEEVYTIVWKRSHQWSNKTIDSVENETVVTWDHLDETDEMIEQNVTFSIHLIDYGNTYQIDGEIKDVFYENSSFMDTNLKTTIESYISSAYEPHKQELFTKDAGRYYEVSIAETVPSWVIPDAFDTLIQLYQQISNITVDEDINPMNYPHPQQLVSLAFQDIIQKFEANMTHYENKQEYFDQNKFSCTGYKAMYAIRCWYVSILHQILLDLSNQLLDDVNSEIDDALDDVDGVDKTMFDETMNENIVSSLQRQLSIPFSVPMQLTKKDGGVAVWNESLLLSIDHQPDYPSCFTKESVNGKEEYFLGIKNTCLLGPSGLPILPITPTTPWVVSLNTWLIQIRGTFSTFSVSDMNDETVFHPLFCYEPLEFTRRNEVVRATDGSILGWNTRLSYGVDTVSCSLVPSWGCMIGDTDGILVEHHGRKI